jgi:hypothetical protein
MTTVSDFDLHDGYEHYSHGDNIESVLAALPGPVSDSCVQPHIVHQKAGFNVSTIHPSESYCIRGCIAHMRR